MMLFAGHAGSLGSEASFEIAWPAMAGERHQRKQQTMGGGDGSGECALNYESGDHSVA